MKEERAIETEAGEERERERDLVCSSRNEQQIRLQVV